MKRLRILSNEIKDVSEQLKQLNQYKDVECLQQADVIAMTTTGAAKHKQLLDQVRSKILVAEEAGQILEAHLITALRPEAEHLVLIGDYEQLRPSVNVYELETKYHLDISMFERLIKNGI